MNRSSLLLLVLSVLPASAQDWTAVNVGTTGDLHALQLGATFGFPAYAVGDDGFVATSLDLTSWTPENLGTSADLRSLIQPSLGQVWVSGEAGVVRVKSGPWFTRDIPDADEFYVLSSTASGQAIAHGSGGSIWKTANGGLNWTLEHSAGVALHAGAGGTTGAGLSVGDGGTILRTVDGGLTWTPKPSGTTADLYGVVGGGFESYAVGENGTILFSPNGGETWSPRLSGTTRTLRAVHAWGNARVVAVGDDGTVLVSAIDGARWCRLDPGTTADLFGVGVDGLTLIQAVGENGLFVHTTTGGGPCVPAVDATITRVGTGNIPATGGPLTFRVTLTNPTPEPQTAEAWVDAVIPGGSTFGPIVGPQTVTLAPGQTVGPITFTQQVPAQAPAGVYTVRLRVGDFSASPLLHDESTFTFTKNAFLRESGDLARGEDSIADAAAMTPADWGGVASFTDAAPEVHAAGSAAPAMSAFPNPFRTSATLQFTISEAGRVRLAAYDALGREVAVLVDEAREAGAHAVAFDASSLPAGVYVVRLEAGGQTLTQRLTLLR
jgi:photosystem II stability/assembly factor-like uncharacterized protein